MSVEISVEAAKKNLEELLAGLSPGEAATLIGPEGEHLALLVSMKAAGRNDEEGWAEEWEALAQEIDRAWKSKKGALEILREMRR